MKNLRKVLAVVLVVCMAFSLMAVASAKNLSDYTDAASVTSKEAVDVMAATGLMTGDGSTNWNPTGTFTREQAAKVVASLLSVNAGKFTVTKSSFTDVAATRWSAPYIEYAVSKGVISGRGDGTFGPADPVTGSQMAVMLLKVLGYGKNNEFATNWEINAIDMGLAKGVLTGTADFSAPCTREQVAQYAFNILFKAIQVFDKTTEEYIPTVAAPLTVAARLGLTKPDATANGVAAYKYAVNSVAVTGPYYTDNVIATSFNGTPVADFMDITKTTYVAPAAPIVAPAVTSPIYYLNGTATLVGALPVLKVGDTVKLIDNTLDGIKNIDKIAITTKTVAVVGSTGVTVTPQINGQPSLVSVALTSGGPIAGNALTVSGYSGLVKGDVILYYPNGTNTVIEKATANAGKINAFTGTTSITINGAAYIRNDQTGSMVIADMITNLGYNKDITFYTDSNGLIVYAVGPTTAPAVPYVVVLGSANVPGNGWTPGHVEAKLLFPDGTTKVVTIKEVDAVNASAALIYAEIDTELNVFYKYDIDATTGAYDLDTVVTDAPNNITLSAQTTTDIYKNTPDWCQDGTSIGNATSVFLVRTGTAPAYTYTAYVGIANLPAFTNAAAVQIIDTGATARTTIAYIMDPATSAASTSTAFFYNLDATVYGESAPGAADGYYLYTALVNGVATPVKTAAVVAAKGLYSVVYNASNVVTSKTEVGTVANVSVTGTDTTAAAGGIVGLGASFYSYTDTAVVYIANANGTVTTTTIGSVTSDATDNDVFYAYLTAGAVSTLYIVVVA